MSSVTPDQPRPDDALRRLETLPASTAGLVPTAEAPTPARRVWLWYVGGGALVLAALWLVLGGPVVTDKVDGPNPTGSEGGLAQALRDLGREPDLPTCRLALQQIGAEVGVKDALRPPALSGERRGQLQTVFDLDDAALAEIDAPTFTKLDAVHLEQCLLLRDVARAIETTNLAGATAATLQGRYLERAKRAFDWAMRQVRLEDVGEARRRVDPLAVPPAFALRRSIGSPLERALVFLALLDQMQPAGKLRGCLVYYPEKGDAEPALWACGVLLEDKPDLYLFDPRLGIALPGKDGQGIATLGAVVREPALLAPLSVRGDLPYRPAGTQVSQATLRYVVSLSALAPRAAHLQDKLLGTAVPVRLSVAADRLAGDLEVAAQAAGLTAQAPHVAPWVETRRATASGEQVLRGVELLRRFYPVEEGGDDKRQYLTLNQEQLRRFRLLDATRPDIEVSQPFHRLAAWRYAAVPFEIYPEFFADPANFPRNVGLGQRMYNTFAGPFLQAYLGGGTPRDQVLRGRATRAAPPLVAEREQLRTAYRALQGFVERGELRPRIEEWLTQATQAYADEFNALKAGNADAQADARRRIGELWATGEAVHAAVIGTLASPRLLEVTYQLALCKHELAESKQARLELARELNLPSTDLDRRDTEQAWHDALGWWQRYVNEFTNAPALGTVRRQSARALQCLGRNDEAAALLRDLTPPLWPTEQAALLYLAGKLP